MALPARAAARAADHRAHPQRELHGDRSQLPRSRPDPGDESWTETDARSSLRGEETVDGTPTYAIEEVPQREDIGYKKIVVWLGHDDLVPRRLELYEDAAEPKKRIAQSDVKSIGAIPVPHHLEVATPAAGSHTVIEIADVQFNQKLDPDLFTQRYLERGGR